MRVGMVYGPRQLGVEEVALPPVGPRDALVRVKAAGICGSDLHYHRRLENPPTKRRAGGHELSAQVVEVGTEVEHVAPGDRVGIEPLLGCGRCRFCQAGDYHLCHDLTHPGGGFGEYTVATARNVFRLPDSISDDAAAILDCVAVGVHAVQRAKTEMTDTAVVLGDAAIGISTMQVAKANGARKVGIVGHHPPALEIARSVGADFTINAKEVSATDTVMELTDGKGVDVVYESVGGASTTLTEAVKMVRPGGIITVIGSFTQSPPIDLRRLLRYEVDVRFAWSYATWNGVPEFQIAIDLLADGRVDADAMVTHRYPLEDIQAAFEAALNKYESNAVKVLIKP